MSEQQRFDHAAATWDDDPERRERARLLAERLLPIIRRYGLRTALDYGAGTGLVGFELAGYLEHITLMDASAGMIDQAGRNIHSRGLDKRMRALQTDLLVTPGPDRYDLIYTLLTLHHIDDTEAIIRAFYDHLTPGGLLCIADLEEEDGSFHAAFPDFDGHNGFDPDALLALLEYVGFTEVDYQPLFSIDREEEDGSQRSYPLFLLTGRKGD